MVRCWQGITFWCDQLGCNAVEFDDILLYDRAVTGAHHDHAATMAAVDKLSPSGSTLRILTVPMQLLQTGS
eukprot:SAG31_NODE_99_length_25388_cov_12.710507_4_plen_71_part_00